jgi:hypothetical protein
MRASEVTEKWLKGLDYVVQRPGRLSIDGVMIRELTWMAAGT